MFVLFVHILMHTLGNSIASKFSSAYLLGCSEVQKLNNTQFEECRKLFFHFLTLFHIFFPISKWKNECKRVHIQIKCAIKLSELWWKHSFSALCFQLQYFFHTFSYANRSDEPTNVFAMQLKQKETTEIKWLKNRPIEKLAVNTSWAWIGNNVWNFVANWCGLFLFDELKLLTTTRKCSHKLHKCWSNMFLVNFQWSETKISEHIEQ